MKIIISPAKKMRDQIEFMAAESEPHFLAQSKDIATYLNARTFDELKQIWQCNDALTKLNQERLPEIIERTQTVAALLSYEGLQYQYMAPHIFDYDQWAYVNQHLVILSGLYGALRPLDAVKPYRIEMQAKFKKAFEGHKTLYHYWQDTIYQHITSESNIILNLASKEYSQVIEPFLKPADIFVTCVFGEEVDGKAKIKATQAKMARGEMVRFLATHQITTIEGVKRFDAMNYRFSDAYSNESTFVFLKG